MDEVFDLEFEARGDAVLQAVGFEDVRVEEQNLPGDDSAPARIPVLMASGFRLDPDGTGQGAISGHFQQPVEVWSDENISPSVWFAIKSAHRRRFEAAVRAKLGPALSAKYLNA